MELKDKLLELVERQQFSSINDLLEGLPGEDAGEVLRAANQFVREGKLVVTKKGKYALPGKLGLVEGQLEVKRRRIWFCPARGWRYFYR